MSAKADEPRTLIKVTLSQRERIRKYAKKSDISMIEVVERMLHREAMA